MCITTDVLVQDTSVLLTKVSQNRRGNVRFCIFDMDGLLLDTESIYLHVIDDILKRYGKSYEFSIKSQMMGRKSLEAAELLISLTGIPMTAKEFLAETEPMLHARFSDCTLLPGAERLVRHLKQHRIPMALATGSDLSSYQVKTKNHQALFSLFDTVITGDHPKIQQGKPAPDIFLHAAHVLSEIHQSDNQASQYLVFEDSVNGIRAAKVAGMFAVMVPDPQVPLERQQEADQVLLSLEDFLPEEWGLPPFSEL